MNRTGIALLAATLVLGVSFSASAAPVTTTLSLGQGWNMIGLPTVPLDPAVPSVLADLGAQQDLNGNVARWDPITRSNISYDELFEDFGNMLVGDGYWVLKFSAGTTNVSYQGVDVSGDHWISLPRAGWTLIGYPNNTPTSVALASVSVTNGIETKSWDDATAAGWVAGYAYTWDNSVSSNIPIGTDGIADLDSIEKGKGAWVQSNQDNLALIVPGS